MYEAAFSEGLRANGINVVESRVWRSPANLGRISEALPIAGPDAWIDSALLLARAKQHSPNAILFWHPTHVLRRTLHQTKKLGITTISYNNDDPFSPMLARNRSWRKRNRWKLYRRALTDFDLNFFYRPANVVEAVADRAAHTDLLLPYFVPTLNRPIELSSTETARFETDLVFVGHFEPDGRDRNLEALARAGMSVRVWGDNSWRRSTLTNSDVIPQPILRAGGADYQKALAGAKVCLCFLSKLNRDVYTRRCFEIPASGRVMLAERTHELLTMFKEDKEACFFSSREELIDKARLLVSDAALRGRIAEAGRARVWADGRDVTSTARSFLEKVKAARPELRKSA
jgi:spore maturation protein CgeB